MAATKKPAKRTPARDESTKTWTDDELDAIKEHNRELKAAARRGKTNKEDGEADLQAKIAEMPQPDRGIAEQVDAIVKASAPALEPRTWYGMPAWSKDGRVICFFQPAVKFKARYQTIGFNDGANLDDGAMWATSFAVIELTPADEKKIAALVKKAAS